MNEYSQMVKDLTKPGSNILKTLAPDGINTLHMAVGLMGEVTELVEHELESNLSFDSTIIEELGDIEFYFEGLCQAMFISMETIKVTESEGQPSLHLIVSAGKMLDLCKKMVIYNKDVSLMEFINLLIEVRRYLDNVYTSLGKRREDALKHNMTKLLKGDKARYKEGKYSDEAAWDRVDKT